MATVVREKTPEGILDYLVDWSNWLSGSDTIVNSTWRVDNEELGISSDSFTDTQTVVFPEGGVINTTYTIANTIGTSGNPAKTTSRSFKIKIKEHRFLQE